MGRRRRLERPGLPRHRRLPPQAAAWASSSTPSSTRSTPSRRSPTIIRTGSVDPPTRSTCPGPRSSRFIEGAARRLRPAGGATSSGATTASSPRQRNGDDTPLLSQDAGFRQILRHFLDTAPRLRLPGRQRRRQLRRLRLRPLRLHPLLQRRRGRPAAELLRPLLFPPDKTSDIPDIYNPDATTRAPGAACSR